jgi:hypothetical protein
MFDPDWSEMWDEWEGRLNMLAENRVRRLYCLECGVGAVQMLPADGFVSTHNQKHNLKKDEQEKHYLVVERPITDATIRLDDNLASMFQKTWLEWGGAVQKAKKYEERAKNTKGTVVPISGSRL